MTNFDRNTRTLIVSFLVAIFALIPLRFIEAGEQRSFIGDAQVLGESSSVQVYEDNGKAEIKFEAPYDKLETCASREKVTAMENEIVEKLNNSELSEDQIDLILDELRKVETSVCQ
ncbi:MAG: hypothetical protein US68_C0001G0064 [Candidatus Shapirobacteria bacterium GW2011_GWE1_38_10]|uniref:Uncharacterized protein n=1 Tax=Candidatus Shapirobacteria bacterium GW2011_GWE1_38_10 TaxID=1618488 RepID=A0A0G0IIM6_9BACT|nr:MAG: hypothetical protein US46_C0004G0018 [Candidatus Shapirobacteria bacterium GW2011_GWF2_37_20]KKQ50865.1 MAG: hypothetical protein US68_C0001G0064 [Candidatus Shapirobacteria bacterium GW2011_GWE1_38_10]KKQ63634.1 MAG: hypothetical protein US85_C0015G0016 [Candidatus Shapirobacteria bacterium GW2011_GWF1_38_23]HBP51078.1 hypothetical protein [Candidatus Shapirobacteria bacterium]